MEEEKTQMQLPKVHELLAYDKDNPDSNTLRGYYINYDWLIEVTERCLESIMDNKTMGAGFDTIHELRDIVQREVIKTAAINYETRDKELLQQIASLQEQVKAESNGAAEYKESTKALLQKKDVYIKELEEEVKNYQQVEKCKHKKEQEEPRLKHYPNEQ